MHCLTASEIAVSDEEFRHAVENRLRNRLGRIVRNFRLTAHLNRLILHGATPSYYGKQMAQEAAMEVTGLIIEANQIEVV